MKMDRVLRASSLSTGDKISCASNLKTVEYRHVCIESWNSLNPFRLTEPTELYGDPKITNMCGEVEQRGPD